MQNLTVIGIDHGYGNMKTAHCCFPSGVTAHGEKEPIFKQDVLVYEGKYYSIGTHHKEFISSKAQDDDFYLLTLAAIAQELRYRSTVNARVLLAVGLPLTWIGNQKEQFKAYLLRSREVDFKYDDTAYHIEIKDVEVYPQGFAAVATRLEDFSGLNMLADIGNGTMNVMYINEGIPDRDRCYTEKFGTHQCMLAVKEALLRETGMDVHEAAIEQVLRTGMADIAEEYIDIIYQVATEYVNGIFSKLREHGYDPKSMRLFVIGGGGCLVKNFGKYDRTRVTIEDDICATAKGYEAAAKSRLM